MKGPVEFTEVLEKAVSLGSESSTGLGKGAHQWPRHGIAFKTSRVFLGETLWTEGPAFPGSSHVTRLVLQRPKP